MVRLIYRQEYMILAQKNPLEYEFEYFQAHQSEFSAKHTGIRHSLFEDVKCEPDFADAKVMLVSYSAFINYLILKSSQT